MSALEPRGTAPARPRASRLANLWSGNAWAVAERGARVLVGANLQTIVSGFFEPVFYLLSMGIGMGALIGAIEYHGVEVEYAAYIAPALLATSAMNGAFYEATQNVFWRMRYAHLYDTMLATRLGPLDVAVGEIALPMLRSAAYSICFVVVMMLMGVIDSPLALLVVPAALLIGLAFAAFGFMVTTFVKRFQQLDFIEFVMLPMFLLSATFFPITVLPVAVQWLIQAFPLYHAVELCRQLTTGLVDGAIWWHLGYFAVMIVVAIPITTRRLAVLFLR